MRRTAQTALGEVDYETVECASCEQEVLKDEASDLVCGDVVGSIDWGTLGKIEYNFKRSSHERGYLCPYCHDSDGLLGVKLGPEYVIDLSTPMAQMVVGTTVLILFLSAIAI